MFKILRSRIKKTFCVHMWGTGYVNADRYSWLDWKIGDAWICTKCHRTKLKPHFGKKLTASQVAEIWEIRDQSNQNKG